MTPTTELTPETLTALGCRHIHWNASNPARAYYEYYLSLDLRPGPPIPNNRLSVHFDRIGKPPVLVYLIVSQREMSLPLVTTVEQFQQLYELTRRPKK